MGCKVLSLSVVAFIICLMKSEHVGAQCSPPRFGENVVLSDQFILSSSFSDGSSVIFECIRGYKPVDSKASRSVTCLGNNKWTDLALNCTRKPCGSLPDFPHGRYEIPDGILFGDTVTAVCDKGYLLSGRGSQRTCRAEGVWDGRDPVCEAVKCPPPPVVENGQLEDMPLESYDYLQAVTYTCNRGFTLGGNSALYCSENGTFQPAPPKCVDGCPKPEITHSIRTGGKSPPYKLNNFIEYKCETGYKMDGDGYIVCTENGWKPEPSECTMVKCPQPPVVENGQLEDVLLESYEYLQTVTYKCNRGFTLVGNAELRCSEDETFQPAPPKCVAQCSKPHFGGNVVLSDEFQSTVSFSNGSTVMFECISGYEPVDSTASKSVYCVEKQWTDLQLICIAQCSKPHFGGNVVLSDEFQSTVRFSNGSTVMFECISGYEPVDSTASKSVYCVEKQWTDLQLICIGPHNSTPDPHHRTPVYVIVLSVLAVIIGLYI